MRFGLYCLESTNMMLRCVDGEYTMIHPSVISKATGPSQMWEILSTAKGNPCNQDWAKSVNKTNLIKSRQIGELLYGIPKDVDLYTGVYRRRTEIGLTQVQLAKESGLDERRIQRMEKGDIALCNLTAKNLFALADALKIDARRLTNY